MVFRKALKERTRKRTPFEWATVQNNLGIALSELGERDGTKGSSGEAVAAYRKALTERPDSWGIPKQRQVWLDAARR